MTWTPKRGDKVRIGPVAFPQHEWVGTFIRFGVDRKTFVVDHPNGRRFDYIKIEALRGPATC